MHFPQSLRGLASQILRQLHPVSHSLRLVQRKSCREIHRSRTWHNDKTSCRNPVNIVLWNKICTDQGTDVDDNEVMKWRRRRLEPMIAIWRRLLSVHVILASVDECHSAGGLTPLRNSFNYFTQRKRLGMEPDRFLST